MMRVTVRSCLLAALAATVLAFAWPAGLSAQVSCSDLADALVRDTYDWIRKDALRPPDVLTLLHETVLTAERTLVSAGVTEPPPLPAFTGQEDRDLTTAAAYVQAAVSAAPRDSDRIVAAVLRAMVRAVADPLGAVFMPLEFIRYHRELRGEHTGIGVQVDAVRGQIVFTDVTAGGPAARAGVIPGDVLLEADGHLVADSTPDQVIDRLRGAAGTTVSLAVRRTPSGVELGPASTSSDMRGYWDDVASTFPVNGVIRLSLSREPVRENPTRWKLIEPHIGYLRLLEFSEEASSDVSRSLGGLVDAGATALLLDLRENGGGLLDEAIAVASAFLPDGIVAMEERRGLLNPLSVIPQAHRFSGPVVVLVSNFTASSSEVVAGALQDTGAPLVGERTFGKATVQTIYPLCGGWGLRLTTARYYTRRGRKIDGQGLRPDLTVPMDEDLIQGPKDIQLRDATNVLRAQMAAGTGRRP